ncbi:MAG: DUF6174 domain-containing protein [Nocardioidaceae bacterium]
MTAPRRAATAAAASLVLATLLAACGSQTAEPRATDSSSAPPTESPTPTAAPTVGTYPEFPLPDYDFTVRVSCFCADANQPIRVEVRDGAAVSATYASRGPGHAKGDPAPKYRRITLAEVIAAANDVKAATVDVTWPAGQDYPTSVWVDQDTMMADEEIGYEVSDVTPVQAGG